MELSGRRVLVTGGAGFIGSHTVDALLARGAHVSIVDDLRTGRKGNLNDQATFYEMNCVADDLSQVFEREQPEFVYHFAFNVLVPRSVQNPLLDLDSIAGSINLLQCAKAGAIERVVFSSSGFLYGNTEDLPVGEDTPIDPVTPYVVAKHAVENYLRFYGQAFGIPFAILRYAAIYGPRQVTGAMADYIRKLHEGGQAEIWGDGTKTRDYVYIDDVVRANLTVLDLPGGYSSPIFNIGSGKETTLNDIYRTIARILGSEPAPIYHPDRAGEQMRYGLDSSKIEAALGWRPTIAVDEGVRRTVSAAVGMNRPYDERWRR